MENYENWMGNLPEKFISMPLNKIAIPGFKTILDFN